MKNSRASNKTNIAATGIAEVYGELEEVMDKIIEEVDIVKNKEKKKKETEEKQLAELKNAAGDIRLRATKRINTCASDGDVEPRPMKNRVSWLESKQLVD